MIGARWQRPATYDNIEEARAAAVAQSVANPRRYYIITNVFGWMVSSSVRLHVFAPSDGTDWSGATGTYWHRGIEKAFTTAQKISDQNATPISR